MRRASSSSEREGRRCSLESGGERLGDEVKERPVRGKLVGEREMMGRRQVVRKFGTDLER